MYVILYTHISTFRLKIPLGIKSFCSNCVFLILLSKCLKNLTLTYKVHHLLLIKPLRRRISLESLSWGIDLGLQLKK